MKLYLVRHAKALKRSGWKGSDRNRPLSKVGQGQAQAIAAFLRPHPFERILSSPHLRCRQTVEPLALQQGLPLEVDERLAEGEDVAKSFEVLRALGEQTAVLCSHGDVIPALLCELEERGLEIEGRLLCGKGSTWLVTGPGASGRRASYIAPPAKGGAARRLAEQAASSPQLQAAQENAEDVEEVRVAVLDLGSTSFHLLVAEVTAEGAISRVDSERVMLRLGSVIANDRIIPDEVCDQAIATARALRKKAIKARAEQLLPVATAALRDAENGASLARRIGETIDSPVRILSGTEEARIIFAALRRRVALPPGHSLAIDLGGGSLELAVGNADDVVWETTLPLGVARLHSELVRCDPMSEVEERALRERVRETIAPARVAISRFTPRACIATGGTMCSLARLVTARRRLRPSQSINELFVPREELEKLSDDLLRSRHDERIAMPSMPRHRADLLPSGALLLTTLAAQLGIEGYTVSDWGLREGMIVESLALEASPATPKRAAASSIPVK